MNAAYCQQALDSVGSGVAASLRGVDCAASAMAQMAFGRLFGEGGALLPALTILLTLYVAFFAFALITGRSRLGVAALTPRMLTMGLVLTFATSWLAYQSLVWNLAVGAPDQLAALLTGVSGSATQVFADKIDVVFTALVEATGTGAASSTGGAAPPSDAAAAATFSPPGLLWLGGVLLLLGTVGILATAKIALAILLGLGPVFVVMALFPATRGLFVGWLKGVVMLALTPLFAVIGGSLMLDLSVPILRALAQTPGTIDAKAAMAFFMIGAVHCALMFMVLKIAGTMVAGWSVFGLTGSGKDERGAPVVQAPQAALPVSAATAASEAERPAPSRAIRLGQAAPLAANDTGPAASSSRETRIVAAAARDAAPAPSANASLSRTRGIGSRFRTSPNARLARSMEKMS